MALIKCEEFYFTTFNFLNNKISLIINLTSLLAMFLNFPLIFMCSSKKNIAKKEEVSEKILLQSDLLFFSVYASNDSH